MDKLKDLLSGVLAVVGAIQEVLADGFQPLEDVKALLDKYDTDLNFKNKLDQAIKAIPEISSDFKGGKPIDAGSVFSLMMGIYPDIAQIIQGFNRQQKSDVVSDGARSKPIATTVIVNP